MFEWAIDVSKTNTRKHLLEQQIGPHELIEILTPLGEIPGFGDLGHCHITQSLWHGDGSLNLPEIVWLSKCTNGKIV